MQVYKNIDYGSEEILTFSIITGSRACNARCPYCVSKMTHTGDVGYKEPKVNWRNFKIACTAAKNYRAKTVLLTGKGEPTLYPGQITQYLSRLYDEKFRHEFSFRELQTNGILLAEKKMDRFLKHWYDLWLTTVAISIVDSDPEKNRQIFLPHKKSYIDLPRLIDKLHDIGYSVRLSCVMLKGYVDDVEEVERLVRFSKENKVEQLTMRPVEVTEKSQNKEVHEWTMKHKIGDKLGSIRQYLDKNGKVLDALPHGAIVYDLYGQNVCLANALTIQPEIRKKRQLIFYPDGHLRYDWQYKGAILL